jgi:RteC protein
LNNYFDKLFADLSETLHENTEKEVSIKKTWDAVAAAGEALNKVKERITQFPFKSTAEEISFFKQEKPRFLAEQLYALEMINILTSRPAYDQESIRAWYRQELSGPGRFFNLYKAFYQYYQLEACDLDELLFVRAAKAPAMLLPETQNLDPAFSTNGDYGFAKFIALERVQAYLIDEMKEMDRPGRRLYEGLGWGREHPGYGRVLGDEGRLGNSFGEPKGGGGAFGGEQHLENISNMRRLVWTGESINLVEVAYGIWLTGQVNHGNASVTEIVEFLELCFSVEIGAPHRRWQSISRRKRVATFKYVDEVKAALVKRLEEEWGR